ncbi:hypothetical protein HanRHA438_Chr14g0646531 [Helianthus annuus]|nr:hypothetical protein HanRHA438_Chr14g0646531 [Helianthus annuus]
MSFSHVWTYNNSMRVVLNCFINSSNLLVSVSAINKTISCQWIDPKNFIVARYSIRIITLFVKSHTYY